MVPVIPSSIFYWVICDTVRQGLRVTIIASLAMSSATVENTVNQKSSITIHFLVPVNFTLAPIDSKR